ncbi:MAG: hypothetical protein ACKOWE_01195 [Micrococcales bacterium]
MEFIGAVLATLIFGVLLFALCFIFWLMFRPIEPDVVSRPYRPITDAEEDENDPNWEDHIRHDPYHPGGSGGHF